MSGIQREVILHAPASYYVRDVRVIPRLAADNTNGTLTVDVDVRRHETSSGALTDLRVVAELFPESNKGRRLLPLAASTGAAAAPAKSHPLSTLHHPPSPPCPPSWLGPSRPTPPPPPL